MAWPMVRKKGWSSTKRIRRGSAPLSCPGLGLPPPTSGVWEVPTVLSPRDTKAGAAASGPIPAPCEIRMGCAHGANRAPASHPLVFAGTPGEAHELGHGVAVLEGLGPHSVPPAAP